MSVSRIRTPVFTGNVRIISSERSEDSFVWRWHIVFFIPPLVRKRQTNEDPILGQAEKYCILYDEGKD
jgi:hypothetical protein